MKRRHFLGATAIGFPAILESADSPNSKVNIACVGVGGKGFTDLKELSIGHNIVAICDIDEQRLDKAASGFPKAKKYIDWRKLLEQPDIDAVSVTTPDHTHAPATMSAMNLGKHVFTQKPLTHTVHEARRLAEVAAEKGLITQMGIQHHATRRLKTAVHAVREDGVIGKVSEVHTWTDRPGTLWKQGLIRVPGSGVGPPDHIHWDNWIGTAPARAYWGFPYHPFHWRGWWDFGTGVAGDMGCHILDPVVDALQLGPPKIVRAEGPPPERHPESGPTWCIIHYEFPGTKYTTDTLKLTWYEAGKLPPRDLFQAPADWPGSKNGVLFIGEKGNLFVGFPEMPELFPKEKFADYEFADIPDHYHYREWTGAIANGGTTSCPFDYSGPLTETVLLGNVAYRSGETIEWDSKNLKVSNAAEANRFVKREYRKGWEVPGLS